MNLKEIRRGKNLTQEAVAQQAGISRATYTNIETGKRRPAIKTAKKLAAVLGCDWTQFFDS